MTPTPNRTMRIPDTIWDAAQAKAKERGETLTSGVVAWMERYANVDDAHYVRWIEQQGRCGQAPPITGSLPEFCQLPAAHLGWHRSDEGTEWGTSKPAALEQERAS